MGSPRTLCVAHIGCSADNAQSVARALVAAEADGLKGHGLSRISDLSADGAKRQDRRRCARLVDATAPRRARDRCREWLCLSRDRSCRRRSCRRSRPSKASRPHRSGAPIIAATTGLPCEALARKGLVALIVRQYAGRDGALGRARTGVRHQPDCVRRALAGREPAVVDLALSRVARGPIVAAKQRGETIPEGWALDADGNATTDPEKPCKAA